jgi:C-terminal processing protease CtpA/Prc
LLDQVLNLIGNKILIYVINILGNTFEVTLNRGHAGLGLSLAGGLAENKPIEIIDIYDNQPAALSGRLEIGDVILSINDVVMYNQNVRVCSFLLI